MSVLTKIKKVAKRVCGSNDPRVNLIRLSGIIRSMGTVKKGLNIEDLADDIKKAFTAGKPKAVAIVINSPGGSPVQSEYIYKYIRKMSKEKKVPVYCFAEDVAASGGYFLACAGDEFYVSANTVTGSIGVLSSSFGFVDLMKKLGVERRIYKQGENKTFLDPFSPENKNTTSIMEAMLKDVHASFKAVVLESRKGKLKNPEDQELFSGAIWSGTKAVELGLADGIDDVWSFMERKYGKDVNICNINKPKGWLKRKLSCLAPESLMNMLVDVISEREQFSRYGL